MRSLKRKFVPSLEGAEGIEATEGVEEKAEKKLRPEIEWEAQRDAYIDYLGKMEENKYIAELARIIGEYNLNCEQISNKGRLCAKDPIIKLGNSEFNCSDYCSGHCKLWLHNLVNNIPNRLEIGLKDAKINPKILKPKILELSLGFIIPYDPNDREIKNLYFEIAEFARIPTRNFGWIVQFDRGIDHILYPFEGLPNSDEIDMICYYLSRPGSKLTVMISGVENPEEEFWPFEQLPLRVTFPNLPGGVWSIFGPYDWVYDGYGDLKAEYINNKYEVDYEDRLQLWLSEHKG